MRPIDADAFRRELDNHWPFTRDEQSKHGMADLAKSTVLTVLNQMPTIEERTGKWIDIKLFGIGCIKCSECNYTEMDMPEARSKFCPECGAKMEVSNGRVV